MGDHLTALDATFLELEQVDRSAHMHIGAVMIFDPQAGGGAPRIERIREEFSARLPELPRWSQRLSTPHTGGLHWPTWEDDDAFDIANHVFIAPLPDPAGEPELRHWAEDYYSRRLDRTKPLWEVAVTELADGRWAMTSKTHHCMVDGVGSVDIAQTILDLDRHAEPQRKPPQSAAEVEGAERAPRNGALGPVADLAGAGFGVARAGLGAVRAALRVGVDTATHPREAFGRARAVAELIYSDEVIAAPRTSLNRPIGPNRRLAVIRIPLGELKLVKNALGGTVNDVVLAASAGGLRRLLLSRDEDLPIQGLRAMVPVNLRTASERLALGNKITSLFVHLPVVEDEAKARYVRQMDEAEALKSGTQAIGSSTLLEITSLAPPVIHSALARSLYATRLFNVTITNVPGPQQPMYAFGSRLREAWPLVPLAAEHALGIAVFSYDGDLFFCLNADRDAVPDLDVVASGLEDSLRELVDLAGRRASAAEPPAATREAGHPNPAGRRASAAEPPAATREAGHP